MTPLLLRIKKGREIRVRVSDGVYLLSFEGYIVFTQTLIFNLRSKKE